MRKEITNKKSGTRRSGPLKLRCSSNDVQEDNMLILRVSMVALSPQP